MSMYSVGYNAPYQSSYGGGYPSSYGHSYSAPPQYSSSHNSYSYSPQGGQYHNSYSYDPLMGQIGDMVSNIIGGIEQQRRSQYSSYGHYGNYGQYGQPDYYPSYPANYPVGGCEHPYYSCPGNYGGGYYPPEPYNPYQPEPETPISWNPPFNPNVRRRVKQQTGGGNFNRDYTYYQVTDDGGNDHFNIDSTQSKFVFKGDDGPNNFRIRGESNLIKIMNLGADDTVSVYNHEDLIILDERETRDGHAIALYDPNSGNRILLYSDQKDRGTDFLLDRLRPDYYTGLDDE